MIQKQLCFAVGEKIFMSFEDARRFELTNLFAAFDVPMQNKIADHLLTEKAKILDILTMTPRSRAKARKVNGASKKRGTKPAVPAANSTP